VIHRQFLKQTGPIKSKLKNQSASHAKLLPFKKIKKLDIASFAVVLSAKIARKKKEFFQKAS